MSPVALVYYVFGEEKHEVVMTHLQKAMFPVSKGTV